MTALVAFKSTPPAHLRPAAHCAVILPFATAAAANRCDVLNDEPMHIRPLSSVTGAPGATIRALRTAREWSMQRLADQCRPAIDKATVHRIETGSGFTSDTLHRIAHALGVTVPSLFLPPEFAVLADLSDDQVQRVVEYAHMLRDAETYRRR